MENNLITVAKIHTEFPEKFGIPRQSGLVPSLRAEIVFGPEFRSMDAIRGLEEFSHIWLLWSFSKANSKNISLTVTPPRLGGKEKKGVFATRAPFRPNGIGLSSVKLEEIYFDEKRGPILVVSGADLLDGTPIYDIKPYLPYTDSHPDAKGSFAEVHKSDKIRVIISENLRGKISDTHIERIIEVLEQDPRAAYNKKPDYVYGMRFLEYDIRFTVSENVLVVQDIIQCTEGHFCKIK